MQKQGLAPLRMPPSHRPPTAPQIDCCHKDKVNERIVFEWCRPLSVVAANHTDAFLRQCALGPQPPPLRQQPAAGRGQRPPPPRAQRQGLQGQQAEQPAQRREYIIDRDRHPDGTWAGAARQECPA